jgi:hypothetical protein
MIADDAGGAALPHAMQQQFFGFEGLTARFIATLLPLNQLDAAVPEMKLSLVASHTLAHASLIRLNFRFDESSSPVAHEKCVRAARACVNVIRHLSEPEYAFLDPILAVSHVSLSITVGAWRPC